MQSLQSQVMKYKFLSLFLIGIIVAVFLAENDAFHNFLLHLGNLEYFGAFLAGILFVSSFTVPTSMVLIAILSQDLNPVVISFIGALGSVIGDLLIFKFVKNNLTDELSMLFGKEGTSYVKSVFKSKYIAWTLPILGALIIASPLPDELGVSLLGLAHVSSTKLIIISFLSNFFGILMIASVARVL